MNPLSRLVCVDAAIIFVLAQMYRSSAFLCSLVFPLVGYHGVKAHCVASLLVYGAFCAGVLWSLVCSHPDDSEFARLPLQLKAILAAEEVWLLVWISWTLRRAMSLERARVRALPC